MRLTHLLLNGLGLNDDDVQDLMVHKRFRMLSLVNCHTLSDRALVYIANNLTHLQMLNIDCGAFELCQFSESTIYHMLKVYCKSLVVVNLPMHLRSARVK
jgi:hypothetical protein